MWNPLTPETKPGSGTDVCKGQREAAEENKGPWLPGQRKANHKRRGKFPSHTPLCLGCVALTSIKYAQFLYATDATQLPASWALVKPGERVVNGVPHANGFVAGLGVNGLGHTNGHKNSDDNSLPNSYLEDKAVRTVYGLVPLKNALDWPIFASYNELADCASWMGGRIPTFEEARSLYEHVCRLKKDEAERKLGKTVPAVNGWAFSTSPGKSNNEAKSRMVSPGLES